jgi:voltage-gated potassium channel
MTPVTGPRAAASRPTAFVDAVFSHRVRVWLLAVSGVVLVGALGYVLFEGWSVLDALYMAVITLTTVGFREVNELDASGRVWTMILAVAGVVIIFGTIGIVVETALTEVASGRREARRMRETVDGLADHYIVCGYGRVGATTARELVHGGHRLVVIDVNPESLAAARADGHAVVEGDATSDATLLAAGVARARGLITTIDSDANNVYVTLSARNLNPRIFVVARANAEGAEAKLLQAGADRAVSPYTRAGRQIAELAIRPRVADFIDAALSHGQLAFSMEELEVAPGGPLDGRSVGQLREEGIFTLALVTGPRAYEANPPSDRVFRAGESLVVSGSADTLRALRERA